MSARTHHDATKHSRESVGADASAEPLRGLAWRVALGLALALAAFQAGAIERPPSDEEQQRLERGEVVYRVGAAPLDGHAVPGARGAIAFVRIPTAPAAVWTILTTPRRYPEIFPGLRAVHVLHEDAESWLIRSEGKVGPFAFSYYTRYRAEPEAHLITWRLDPTHDNNVFADNWGWWRLVPEDGGTLVVYAIGSVPTRWQPLAGFFERRGITRALAALRDAAIRRSAAPLRR